jgi:2-oxoglutarate dehydrogenase E1 component
MVEGHYGPKKWCISTPEEKRRSFTKLLESDHTCLFLGKRFSSAKIFEIEGCESLLPALWAITESCANHGVEAIEMGMAHRGRMNVLHNYFQKSFSTICNKFSESEHHSGDIKFHLGSNAIVNVPLKNGKNKAMHLSLCANPSHLEHVYPVVIGKTKAKQFYIDDINMSRVVPLVLHG